MMNPNLDDPAWLEARESLWTQVADDLSDELSRKEISQLKPMFFETEFDYGNEEKYGEFKHDFEWASKYCPVQTQERWRKYLLEDLPRWLGEDYDLPRYMRSLADYTDSRESMGWDMETELEVIGYLFGDVYVDGEYEFEGRRIAYPITATRIHYFWTSHIYHWLSGNQPQADVKWAHLIDYWASALSYIHPVFFKYKKSANAWVGDPQHYLQNISVLIQDYSLEKLKLKRKKERLAVIESDSGRRQAFAEQLRTMLDSMELPVGFQDLWTAAKQPGFEPSHRFDYLDAEEDEGDQVRL